MNVKTFKNAKIINPDTYESISFHRYWKKIIEVPEGLGNLKPTPLPTHTIYQTQENFEKIYRKSILLFVFFALNLVLRHLSVLNFQLFSAEHYFYWYNFARKKLFVTSTSISGKVMLRP